MSLKITIAANTAIGNTDGRGVNCLVGGTNVTLGVGGICEGL